MRTGWTPLDQAVRGAATGALFGVGTGLVARWVSGLALGGGLLVVGLCAAIGLQAAVTGALEARGGHARWQRIAVAVAALAAAGAIALLQGARFELFGLCILGAGLGTAMATAAPRAARSYVVVAGAAFTPLVLAGLGWLSALPALVAAVPPLFGRGLVLGLAGAALALPALAARFAPKEDALEQRATALKRRAALAPEVAPLVERAMTLRRALHEALDRADGAAAAARGAGEVLGRADGLCDRLLDMGERHAALVSEARAAVAGDVDVRADELRLKAATAVDPVASAEYARAAATLGEQRQQADALHRAADRIVARLTAWVATLERVQLGVAGAHGGAAERAAWDLAPALDALKARADDMESRADAAAAAGEV
ncbi:MAG TPA: hypothetical protein VG389_11525 [Myxococcota bacterium]|jgi:hypothetical protein|nr:hypothetical protein [Myxococcota bacterium]